MLKTYTLVKELIETAALDHFEKEVWRNKAHLEPFTWKQVSILYRVDTLQTFSLIFHFIC